MKRMIIILSIFAIFIHEIKSECCVRNAATIYYDVDPGTCKIYGGDRVALYHDKCSIFVCNHGRPVQGQYCGRGSCNIFGCNCTDGCHQGDPVEEFQRIHGSGVRNVRREL